MFTYSPHFVHVSLHLQETLAAKQAGLKAAQDQLAEVVAKVRSRGCSLDSSNHTVWSCFLPSLLSLLLLLLMPSAFLPLLRMR